MNPSNPRLENAPAAALTIKETRILLYAASGMTTPEIAAYLNRSTETVKSHLEGVRKKLSAQNTPHAIALAYEQAMIKPGALARIAAMRESKAAAQLPVAA